MAVSYEKLFKKLKSAGISTYAIRKNNILAQSTLTRINQKKYVNLETIYNLCQLLNCQPWDIFEFIPDEKSENGD